MPLRSLGSIVANDILIGPMQTVGFPLSDSTRLATAFVVTIAVMSANLLPQTDWRAFAHPGPWTLPAGARHLAWALLVGATGTYVFTAGGIPILQPDAESARVVLQSGRTFLFYLAFLPAMALAIDAGAELARMHLSLLRAMLMLIVIMVCLLAPGSRLPAIMALFAFTAAWMSQSNLVGRRTSALPLVYACGGLAIVAPLAGAIRANYVGTDKGLVRGPLEHALRRAAADSGNTELIGRYSDAGLFSWVDFLVRPFAVYAPGAQSNLGQFLKQAFRMDFEGGGITVSLTAESNALLGPPGYLFIPLAAGLTAGLLTQLGGKLIAGVHLQAFFVLQLACLAFMNLGTAGLVEVIANTFIPFMALGMAVVIIGGSLKSHGRSASAGAP